MGHYNWYDPNAEERASLNAQIQQAIDNLDLPEPVPPSVFASMQVTGPVGGQSLFFRSTRGAVVLITELITGGAQSTVDEVLASTSPFVPLNAAGTLRGGGVFMDFVPEGFEVIATTGSIRVHNEDLSEYVVVGLATLANTDIFGDPTKWSESFKNGTDLSWAVSGDEFVVTSAAGGSYCMYEQITLRLQAVA